MSWDENDEEKEKITPSPKIIKNINATGNKVFELMDAEDEKQIVKAELFDETVKTLVYQPKQGDLTLTINGIFEAARRFKNIDTGILKIEEKKDGIVAYGYAHNIKDNIKVTLAVEQPLRILQAGNLVKDPFAFQKAQSKAIRNCVRKVIPANTFQAMIKLFVKMSKESKKVQKK